ncbi:MAG TPA: hypothetical protein VKC51_10295 [Lacunisphaera sp.]|nr:hypothetical protein [Lacunisphaera sp.]
MTPLVNGPIAGRPLRKVLLVLLTLVPALLAPLSASAKDMRFPEKGSPAYVFVLPDDWSAQPDDSGNLIMASANHVASLVILVGEAPEALDEVARVALETAQATSFQRKEPVEISGFKGFTYFSSITNAAKVSITLEMTIVRVDEKNIASASLLLASGVAKADEADARLVRNGLKLLAK